MKNILETLNREQKEAVLHDSGALLVLAGAGSGKTRVLTVRIKQLVDSGVNPENIMAVTFTNKAAKEMVERLSKLIGEEKSKKLFVGTFHSIAGRILRYDIDKYKDLEGKSWNRNYVIYDEQDSLNIIKQAIKKCNLDEKIYQPKLVKTIISNAKNKMQDAFTYSERAKDFRSQKYSEIYLEYEKQLQLNNALDFDDMLTIAVKLLETNEQVRNKYYNRFKHLLVDEFQDTNLSQYRFIKAIYANNLPESEIPKDKSLCVVGDIDQSIYSWRGADFRILLNFQSEYKNAQIIKLEQNYRSTENILNAANEVIKNNTQRISKNLYSNAGNGSKINVYEASDETDEAVYVARMVKRLCNNGHKLSDIAVLYRTNSQSRTLEEACISNHIPYRIYGGLKFYDRKEIKDIVAYLKVIYNFNDSVSLKRIINTPKRGIGAETVNKLETSAQDNGLSLFELITSLDDYEVNLSPATKTKIKNFAELIFDLIDSSKVMNIPEFLKHLIDKTGYIQAIREEDDEETAEGRIDNLQEFITVATEFEPTETDNIIGEFLTQVSLVSDLDSMDEANEVLTLMTLHSAKGLEYDVVFLTGLEEGIFPHNNSNTTNTELEEERRLMYVGVTRAKKDLFITHATKRRMWGESRYNNPSRFIAEIPAHLCEFDSSDGFSSTSQRSSFSSAVNTIRNSSSSSSVIRQSYDGSIAPVTSFGKNFVSPQKRKANLIKSQENLNNIAKKQEEDKKKIEEILKNNPIKQKILARLSQFKQGDRVFHTKYGVGTILSVTNDGSATTFKVDFKSQGVKELDGALSGLKKF
ncbi:UvrD-helicase domain-containing protein [bacterium]|nr:UvrD-helicase domain-containing protein [bacterium]